MRSRVHVVLLLVVCLTGFSAIANARGEGRAESDEELKTHLESLRRRVEDPSTDMGQRERLTLEMASTLDRAALAELKPEERRARWTQAVKLLDQFTEKNPGHPEIRAFQVQAAVYIWARAKTWLAVFQTNPTDASTRSMGIKDLKECVSRLKPLLESSGASTDVFTQNVRFRLGQAFADLADAEPVSATARRGINNEALAALASPITEPSLAGYAHLLRARVLSRNSRFEEATSEIDLAEKGKAAPSESEIVEERLNVLIGKGEPAKALRLIDSSRLEPALKAAQRARVRLRQRVAGTNGAERVSVELALFDELRMLRGSGHPESRVLLIEAARALREPGPGQAPDSWDLLADGASALGDPARAGELDRRAAEKASSMGQSAQAAQYRLRAGAYFFQAERFHEADPLLTQVAEDPKAGAARARAGLLRALSRGRSLAAGRRDFTQADYTQALRDQIRNFPDDPSASEARWLLGKLRMAESDHEEALKLWAAIPHGTTRWLESRVEIASARQHDVDVQKLNMDRDAVSRKIGAARSFLNRTLDQCEGDAESNEIRLALARLDLTPGVGDPEEAFRLCERILRSAARTVQRDAARRTWIVALAQLNRWVEAEQAAREEVKASEPLDLVPILRLLDRSAAEADSDLRMRRMGHLLRILIAPFESRMDSLTPEVRDEARLRVVRSLLFSGDDSAARRVLARWNVAPAVTTDERLRDLAETYFLLGAHEMSIDVQRLRARRSATGSLSWFDSRYGLALAYYRSGRPKETLRLIEATSILYPDLGGGELREKFIRLRQRLQPE
ncbi:MAG: hypothetical protein NVSMB9_10930 [Isosphaeraceae bacterium]